MRRAGLILILGVAGAVLGFCLVYFASTAGPRAIMQAPAPELAWLKQQFNLTDAEYQRVCELHAGYLPRCEEMCRRIGEKNAEIKKLLDSTNTDLALVERKLAEAGQLRVQCQTNMLHHFIAVSRQMPPEQGRRYLAWIEERTLFDSAGMMAQHQQSTQFEPAQGPTGKMPQHHH